MIWIQFLALGSTCSTPKTGGREKERERKRGGYGRNKEEREKTKGKKHC